MRYWDLLDCQAIDRASGDEMGRVMQLFTKNGAQIDAFLLWDDAHTPPWRMVDGQFLHHAGKLFLSAGEVPDPGEYFRYPLAAPVLDAGKELCTDFEFREDGTCVSVATPTRTLSIDDYRIGRHAVVPKTGEEMPKAPPPEPMPEKESAPAPTAGNELIGRVALQEIRDPQNRVVMPKGGIVTPELVQRSIREGWLVALAANSGRNHS